MLPIRTSLWGGSALIVGSVLFIVNKFNDMSRVFLNSPIPDFITGEHIALIAIGQLALIVGLLGCYLLYARRCKLIGKLGLTLLLSGGILLALGHATFTPFVEEDSPLLLLVILGVLLMVVGLTLFGAINLRMQVLQDWQSLPLITGLLGITSFFLYDSSQNPVIFLGLRTLFGTGLSLLGVIMWQDTRTLMPPAKKTAQYAD